MSTLGLQEIKPVSSKENQSRIFIGRTDAEAETPIFCYLMCRTDSLVKTLMLGKLRQERNGAIEDEVAEWHH